MKIQWSLQRYMRSLPCGRFLFLEPLSDLGMWVTSENNYSVLVPMRNLEMKDMLMRPGKYYRRNFAEVPEWYDERTDSMQSVITTLGSTKLVLPAFAKSSFDNRQITRKKPDRRGRYRTNWANIGVYYLFAVPDIDRMKPTQPLLVRRSFYHALNRMWPKATLYTTAQSYDQNGTIRQPLVWVIDNPLEDPRNNIVGLTHTLPYNGEQLYEYEIQIPARGKVDAGRGTAEIEALCTV